MAISISGFVRIALTDGRIYRWTPLPDGCQYFIESRGGNRR